MHLDARRGVSSAVSLRTHSACMFRSIVWQMVREAQERRGSVVEVAEVLVAKAKDGQAPLQEKCDAKILF